MATDRSSYSPAYDISYHGMSMYGDMDWDMFPEKTEITDIYEDPYDTDSHWRRTLDDWGPDSTNLLAYEEPRRRTYAHDALNLRDGGARTTTDPWANEDFNTSFRDHDPRGWSVEQPWKEYRDVVESKLKMIDFKDDGDYSVPSGGNWNPAAARRAIRENQTWLKTRLQFATATENRHTGGVGVYDNISRVFKSEHEDTRDMIGDIPGEDAIIPQRITMKISNMVHQGSKFLWANTTTDHKVPVTAYGIIFKNRGLSTLKSQVESIVDDRKPAIVRESDNRQSMIKMMSARIDGTSDQGAREMRRLGEAAPESDKYGNYDVIEDSNRTSMLAKDIIALMGFTENEVKYLESQVAQNAKGAKKMLADLFEMVQMVHKIPPNQLLEIRNELLLTRGGLIPGDTEGIRRQAEVNPKLIEFMENQVSTAATHGDERKNKDSTLLGQKYVQSLQVITRKGDNRDHDIISNRSRAEDTTRPEGLSTVSYKSKMRELSRKNRDRAVMGQPFDTSFDTPHISTSHTNLDVIKSMQNTQFDNKFGREFFQDRTGGNLGSKYISFNTSVDMDDGIESVFRRNNHI